MKTTRHIFWRRWLSDGAASTSRKRSRTRRLSIEYLEARLALDAKSFLSSGGVPGDGTGLVTVTGVAPATSATATVTITNENSVGGSALFTGTSLAADYSTITNSSVAITITRYTRSLWRSHHPRDYWGACLS